MSDKTTDEPKPEKKTYSPEFQDTIAELLRAQTHLGLGDEKFAAGYLKTYSGSTWNRLRNAVYEERESTLADLRTILKSVRIRIARQVKQTAGAGKFYELDQFRALFAAVQQCLTKKNENRLVFYVAPTGAGKSRFLAELSKRQEVTTVRASEPWFGSYFFAALDVLEALEVAGKFVTAGAARKEMLSTMRGRAQVLAIDEGNYFGPRSINMLKDILNETDWTVVICLVPEHFKTMKRYYKEFSQLQRRIHTTIRHQAIAKEEVKKFLTAAGLNGDADQAAGVLAREANNFGAFDFVARVTERLADVGGQHPNLSAVEEAIAVVKKQLDLGGEA